MAQRPPLTEFASKYGSQSPSHRSGLTPDALAIPFIGSSPFTTWENSARDFQRQNLYGFTSEELQRMDCLPTRGLKAGNLKNHVLPLMQRDTWEKGPLPDSDRDYFYAIPGTNGLWEVKNDTVWNLLQPCLILASRMLLSMHMLPWFDALINGNRLPIPDTRIHINDLAKPGAADIESFHRVTNYTEAAAAKTMLDRDVVFAKLQNLLKLQWGFMDGEGEYPDDLATPGPQAYGLTQHNEEYIESSNDPNRFRRVFIWLDCEMVAPLLRSDINSADRMMLHWHVANTMVHELMHAIEYANTLPEDRPLYHEPYFETEPVSEIGFSYEAAINFGPTLPFVHESYLLPMGFWHRRVWPTLKDPHQIDASIVLKDPEPSTKDEFYPIPIQAYEDMQQDDFWEVHIRKFGHGVLHYRTAGQGAQVTYTPLPSNPSQAFAKPTRQVQVEGKIFAENEQFGNSMVALEKTSLERSLEMTPEDRDAIKFGRTFIISSSAEDAFWNQSAQQKRAVDWTITTLQALLRNPNQRPQDRLYLTTELLGTLQKAIENHEMMIAAILSAENTNGITYPDRRKTLLLWNKGTRTFMNRIMSLPFAGNLGTRIQELLTQLERARMVLWAYNDFPNSLDTDVAEITIMQTASTQAQQGLMTECLNTCGTLVISVRPSITTTTRFTVAMIVFEILQRSRPNWQVRRKLMTDLFPAIDWLLSASQITWRGHLQMLKDNYNRLLALTEPLPPPPTAPAPSTGTAPPTGPAPPTV